MTSGCASAHSRILITTSWWIRRPGSGSLVRFVIVWKLTPSAAGSAVFAFQPWAREARSQRMLPVAGIITAMSGVAVRMARSVDLRACR